MRAIHYIAITVQSIGLGLALYLYHLTGGVFALVFAGWCVFWGAYSYNALRAERKKGVEA